MKTKIIFGTLLFSLVLLVSFGSHKIGAQVEDASRVLEMEKKTFIYNQILEGQEPRHPFLNSVASVFSGLSGRQFALNNKIEEKSKNLSSVPVLLYHGIIEEPDRFNITPSGFMDHMKTLHDAGYQTINLEQFKSFMNNEGSLPAKPVLITFDDGRKDSYYEAHPILKVFGYQAVMFIAGSASFFPEKKSTGYYLSEKEIKEMLASGVWEIQSHAMQKTGGLVSVDSEGTKRNFLSNRMWLPGMGRLETEDEYGERVVWELSESKKVSEEKLGNRVFTFAYPFGDYGQQESNVRDARTVIGESLEKVGYDFAFRQVWDNDDHYTYNYRDDPSFLLKRIEPSPSWSGAELVARLEAGKNKNLPYLVNTFNDFDWRTFWGDSTLHEGKLKITAADTSTGTFTFLDGTFNWKNYVALATIDWHKGGYVSLVARYKDNKNYVTCLFSDNSLRIEQYMNGEKKVIVEEDTFFNIEKNNVEFGVVVNGNQVECLVDGNSVARTYSLDSTLSYGGFGFKTWDSQANNSEILVKSVKINEVLGEVEDAIADLPKIELNFKEAPSKPVKVAKLASSLAKSEADESLPIPPPPILPPEAIALPSPVVVPQKSPAPRIMLGDTSGNSTPYKKENFSDTNDFWVNLSGDYFIDKDGALHVKSNASTTAGFVVLDGTFDWKDYHIKTTADWAKGTTFTIIARYQDPKNYMSCTFSYYGTYARAYETINGKTRSLGKTGKLPVKYFMPWSGTNLGVRVNDDEIQCLINDEWVLKYNIISMPTIGGIGFKTWDADRNNSEIIIKDVFVEQIP